MTAGDVVAGRYRLEQRLGLGGMAEVWAAEDRELGRRVALKLLGPNADRARFDREARAAAALAHPNICQLYDYGETDDGRPFMVLEYLPGGTLEQRLVPGQPLPDDETARVATEVAQGLAHAHARGLVHRDLKPANILFDGEGRAKIADFGIVRMGGAGTLTEAGTVLGTAAYISPEQAAGEQATPASDVYSFGVILYRMLAGRLPFEATDPIELVVMHRDATPPPLSVFRATVPPILEGVALAALTKDPAARPPNGAALLVRLGEAPTAGIVAPPTEVLSRRPQPARPQRRWGRAAAVVLVFCALAAGGIAAAVITTRHDGSPPPRTADVSISRSLPHSTKAASSVAVTTAAPAPAPAPPPTTTRATTKARTATTKARTATTHRTTTRAATTRRATTAAPPPTTHVAPTTRAAPPPPTTHVAPTTTAPPPTTADETTTAPETTAPVSVPTTATTESIPTTAPETTETFPTETAPTTEETTPSDTTATSAPTDTVATIPTDTTATDVGTTAATT